MFAKLGELNPQEGGPYAYARDFLGPYAGFQTNYAVPVETGSATLRIAVAAVLGYLAELIPSITAPPASVFATAAVIWLLTFARILGLRVVGALEGVDDGAGSDTHHGDCAVGWYWFDTETFLQAGT